MPASRDFHFYRVTLERAHLVGGFGKIHWIARGRLLAVPPLRGAGRRRSGIVSHMNDDHADAVQLYADKLLGLTGTGWRMTGIDAEGSICGSGGTSRGCPSTMPMAAAEEARTGFWSPWSPKARA